MECGLELEALGLDEFCYIRVTTDAENMAWSSPFWGEEE